MPQPRAVKEQIVQDLTTRLKETDSVYLTDLTGLDVGEVTELRSQLRAESVECRVIKNTLTRLAIANAGLPDLGETLDGPTALVMSSDPVAPAKILINFGKEHEERPRIKGGFLTGEIIDVAQARTLSRLPGRDELLAKTVSGIAAPITGLVFTLSGVLSSLVRTVSAVSQQKAAQEGGE
ncbi:MAG: 50S ribosomal protein L10 [Gemmatimonadetes bacterium]|nr:50S ribosomal protein L10 [Gemmatimonadota bacterium]